MGDEQGNIADVCLAWDHTTGQFIIFCVLEKLPQKVPFKVHFTNTVDQLTAFSLCCNMVRFYKKNGWKSITTHWRQLPTAA